ncbi:MAG: penicillin-insensitive murein endopeptidase [Polyangiaceae bacterium]|nr:penicillin-insensitive murein endopeptidase [Polyangiaceae bacterium]
MIRTLLLALACALVFVASGASASGAGGPGVPALSRRTVSIGLPFEGALRRGERLVETPFLRYVPEYAPTGHFFGTWELVQLLHRAAYRVHSRVPGARLSVGELSRREGGRIAGHGSHQAGRDVDIAFYMLDRSGRPFDPWAFAAFDARGRGLAPNEGLRFDDVRNWELVSRLVADAEARVQYIFVAAEIEARLLAAGRARRASPSLLARAARTMVEPANGHRHANHFHLRIYCPPADRPSCRDQAPFHPWYPR